MSDRSLAELDLAGLPRVEGTWLVGRVPLPFPKPDDAKRQVVLVIDESRQAPAQVAPVLQEDPDAAVSAVAAAFRKATVRVPAGTEDVPRGLPARMVFADRELYDAMSAALTAQGVRCEFGPSPLIDEFAEVLGMSVEDLIVDKQLAAMKVDEGVLPADDDMQTWFAVERRLERRLAEAVRKDASLWTAQAYREYFGTDRGEHYFERFKHLSAETLYSRWAALDYRPAKGAATVAERLLEEGLSAAEAAMLRARLDHAVSLYRVVRCDRDAGIVEYEDLLLGGTITVDDPEGAEADMVGATLPARIFPAGGSRIAEPAGPPVEETFALAMVSALRELGLELTPAGLRRGAHLFGRLWPAYETLMDITMGQPSAADASPIADVPAPPPPPEVTAPIHAPPRVGRNDPCPCGSGKKYKKCCIWKDEER